MNQNVIRNLLLAVIAVLLVVNAAVLLSAKLEAQGVRYKVIPAPSSAPAIESELNTSGLQGWQYVGSVANVLILKR